MQPDLSSTPERALNWLALGLLLAAWNAADDDVRKAARPDSLRNHDVVSVRAATRSLLEH